MKLFIVLTILAVSAFAAEEQSSDSIKTKRQLFGYSHGPVVAAAPAFVPHAPAVFAHGPAVVAHGPSVVAAPVARFASYGIAHHPPPAVVAHAPLAYAHAPVAYAHTPVAYAHAPVTYAHHFK